MNNFFNELQEKIYEIGIDTFHQTFTNAIKLKKPATQTE
jgi:hypothetical protein